MGPVAHEEPNRRRAPPTTAHCIQGIENVTGRITILAFIGHYLPGYKAGGPIRTLENMVDALGDEFEFRIVTSDRDLGDGDPGVICVHLGLAGTCPWQKVRHPPMANGQPLSKTRGSWLFTGDYQGFSEEDEVHPSGAYALSKWEAERRLWQLPVATGLEVVVVRPPLVHGPGVKANMLALARPVGMGVPMPFANARNTRSYVGVANLAVLLLRRLEHPRAAGQAFLAGDGTDFSTPDLVRAISTALHRPSRVLPFPSSPLRVAGWAKPGVGAALLDSLLVDGSKTREMLGWSPPVSVADGFQQMGPWYFEARKGW